MEKKSFICGMLVGVLLGVLVAFVFGGFDRVDNSVQQVAEPSGVTDDTFPLQEEIESSVTTSTPEDIPGMSYPGPSLYYADENSDGYVFGMYAGSGTPPGWKIRIGVGHISTAAVLTMPEAQEGISQVLWFTIPREVVERRSYDAIEIRVEVTDAGSYAGSDSIWFDPRVDQPTVNPLDRG